MKWRKWDLGLIFTDWSHHNIKLLFSGRPESAGLKEDNSAFTKFSLPSKLIPDIKPLPYKSFNATSETTDRINISTAPTEPNR